MNWYKNAKNNRSRFSSWDKTLKAVHDKRDILFLEAEKKAQEMGHILTKWSPMFTAQCRRCGMTVKCNNVLVESCYPNVTGAATINKCTQQLINEVFVSDEELIGSNDRATTRLV
jgi:hypothetical protein